jgi:peptide/nickel transport system permease protein
MKALARDFRFWLGGGVILIAVFLAFFGAQLAPSDPYSMSGAGRFAMPGADGYPLGGDHYGRDLLSRLLYGARLSIIVSVGSVAIALMVGTLMGLMAGYYGGRVEAVFMRFVDVLLSFPTIIFAIFVVALVGATLHVLIITIGVLYIPKFARIMHGVTLAARELEFVEASRALGATSWRVMFATILPNVYAPLMVQAALSLGDAILLEASLSFLGLGPPPPAIAWGRMVAESGSFMHLNAFMFIWPAAVISVVVLAFNVLGDAVRDALDRRRA